MAFLSTIMAAAVLFVLAFSSALETRVFLHADDCSVDTSSAAFARSFKNFKCSTQCLQKQRVSSLKSQSGSATLSRPHANFKL
jgi:hypothetical protein